MPSMHRPHVAFTIRRSGDRFQIRGPPWLILPEVTLAPLWRNIPSPCVPGHFENREADLRGSRSMRFSRASATDGRRNCLGWRFERPVVPSVDSLAIWQCEAVNSWRDNRRVRSIARRRCESRSRRPGLTAARRSGRLFTTNCELQNSSGQGDCAEQSFLCGTIFLPARMRFGASIR